MSSEQYTPLHHPPVGAGKTNSSWPGDRDQADFEIEFFEQVLSRSPDDINVLRALGEQLARKGLWERSLKVEEHLIRLRPEDGVAHYNVACSLAMQGAASQAIEALDRAIHCGYRDFGHLEVDPDLDSLRQLPAYRALLGRHAPRN
jgi:tetratricopeptide (TPR) repeat protein